MSFVLTIGLGGSHSYKSIDDVTIWGFSGALSGSGVQFHETYIRLGVGEIDFFMVLCCIYVREGWEDAL